jgi:hypothetical protein
VFPKMNQELGAERISELGDEIEQRKKELTAASRARRNGPNASEKPRPAHRRCGAGSRASSGAGILPDVAERRRQRGSEATSRARGEMRDQAGAGPFHLLDGELDAQVVAAIAVVQRGDRPGKLHPLRVIRWMVIFAVVRESLHDAS